MSCTSCQHIEAYQNAPYQEAPAPTTKPSQCMKETMTTCLYNAQGMFLCETIKSEVKNEEMYQYKNNYAPWLKK